MNKDCGCYSKETDSPKIRIMVLCDEHMAIAQQAMQDHGDRVAKWFEKNRKEWESYLKKDRRDNIEYTGALCGENTKEE